MNKLFAFAASAVLFSTIISESSAAEPATTESGKPSASTKTEARAKLSPQERAARREARSKKMFERMDANKDGAISKEEQLKVAEEKFMKRDTNKDGKVTREEASAYKNSKHSKKMDGEVHGGHAEKESSHHHE